MRFLVICLFLPSLLCAALAEDLAKATTTSNVTTEPPTTHEPSTEIPTTTEKTTTEHTTKETTTEKPKTTPTTHKTTETTTPTTHKTTETTETTTQEVTTKPPTTTETTKVTTTSEPSTSEATTSEHSTTEESTSAPTTTSAPYPVVPIYEIKGKDGNFCIIVQALTSIRINYMNTQNVSKSKDFDLKDRQVTATGECTSTSNYMELRWQPKDARFLWNITINFEKVVGSAIVSDKTEFYGVNRIGLNYTMEETLFPDAAANGSFLVEAKGTFFKARVGNFYACQAQETIEMKGQVGDSVLLHTQDTKVEAFSASPKSNSFVGDAEPCSADSPTSNLVPILVGVGLAVMILIALVVFLIGSRRRAATYESL